MADSFKLSPDKAVKANLGCGTLILIGIIVMIFSSPGVQNMRGEISGLEGRVSELSDAVKVQADEIKKLREALERERATPAAPKDVKRAGEETGSEGATPKP